MTPPVKIEKRAVLICWKTRAGRPIEIFSNLRILCLSYPQFNYHTMNNYLGKAKLAYENEIVKIERLPIFSRPVFHVATRSIAPVVTRQPLKGYDEKEQDLEYWLKRPVVERLKAVTSIVQQSIEKGMRMEKVISYRQQVK